MQPLPLEVVQLLFLPDEVAKLQSVLGALGKADGARHAVRMADFRAASRVG